MLRLPVGTKVVQHDQSGVVVPRTTPMWPTLVQVRWEGTCFTTFEDPHKLEVDEMPNTAPVDVDPRAEMLARARQRAGMMS